MINQMGGQKAASISQVAQEVIKLGPEEIEAALRPETKNRGQNIMVVEDHDDTRLMLRQMLQLKGYRVVEAANGWEAVKIAHRERPDLILMDLNLPMLDGIAVTCLIRDGEQLRDVPIVAVTADNTADSRADASDAEFTDYMTKPLDFDQLDNLLARLLPKA